MTPTPRELLILLMSGVIAGTAVWFWLIGFNTTAVFSTVAPPGGL